MSLRHNTEASVQKPQTRYIRRKLVATHFAHWPLNYNSHACLSPSIMCQCHYYYIHKPVLFLWEVWDGLSDGSHGSGRPWEHFNQRRIFFPSIGVWTLFSLSCQYPKPLTLLTQVERKPAMITDITACVSLWFCPCKPIKTWASSSLASAARWPQTFSSSRKRKLKSSFILNLEGHQSASGYYFFFNWGLTQVLRSPLISVHLFLYCSSVFCKLWCSLPTVLCEFLLAGE